jgi:hypothetical protein
LRDLVDATFRLLAEWSAMTPHETERLNGLFGYFRDREIEYETGEPVLPGWAAIGDVAARYGSDGADPFAASPEPSPFDDPQA